MVTGANHHCLKVGNHNLADASDRVKGDTPTDAPITANLTPAPLGYRFIPIAGAEIANSSTPTTLPLPLPQFIGAGIATGEAGNGVDHERRCRLLWYCRR